MGWKVRGSNLLSKRPDRLFDPPNLLINGHRTFFPPEVKQERCAVDHPTLTGVEVKSYWSYTAILRPYAFMPFTGTILRLHFINPLQISRFAENWEKFGMSTFLSRVIQMNQLDATMIYWSTRSAQHVSGNILPIIRSVRLRYLQRMVSYCCGG